MDTENIDKQIEELEAKIQVLKLEKEKLIKMPKNYRLAEAIHSKQCRWNHEDGCGWFYENWENPGRSRQPYVEKANAMLREMSFEQAMSVIKFL